MGRLFYAALTISLVVFIYVVIMIASGTWK